LTQQFSLKNYALTGLEPGTSVPQGHAMTTAPRRRARANNFLYCVHISNYA
jgi:hypothetical protein